jgi:hypothetical protein
VLRFVNGARDAFFADKFLPTRTAYFFRHGSNLNWNSTRPIRTVPKPGRKELSWLIRQKGAHAASQKKSNNADFNWPVDQFAQGGL